MDSAVSKAYSRNRTNYSSHNIQKEERHSNTTPPKSEKYHSSLLNDKKDSHNSSIQNKANGDHARSPSVEKHSISDADDPPTLTASQSNQSISSGVLDDMAQLNSQLSESDDKGNFQKHKQANYENVVLKPNSLPPVPPKSIKKSPFYENQEIDTSRKMAPKSSDSLPSNIGQQSSQQPSEIPVESQRRFGTLCS